MTTQLSIEDYQKLSKEDQALYLINKIDEGNQLVRPTATGYTNMVKQTILNAVALKKGGAERLIEYFKANFDDEGNYKPKGKPKSSRPPRPITPPRQPSTPQPTTQPSAPQPTTQPSAPQKPDAVVELSTDTIIQLSQAIINAQKGQSYSKYPSKPIEPVAPDQADYDNMLAYESAMEDYYNQYEKYQEQMRTFTTFNPEEFEKEQELAKSQDIQELGNEIGRQLGYQTNTIGEYINPYRNMSREQVIDEYNRIGGLYLESIIPETKEDIAKKVNLYKEIKAQSEALVDYQTNKPYSIEKGYSRLGFDTFIKTISENPMDQKFKFIQKSIPEVHLKFNPDKSRFEVKQGNEIQLEKNYKIAKQFALKGAFYQDELKELRNAKNAIEKRIDRRCFVIKARKL